VTQFAYPVSDVTVGSVWKLPVAFRSAASGAGTSITLPTHFANDIIIITARRAGSATAPSLPAGWTNINTASNTTTAASVRMGYKIAASSSEVSGTWTNATDLDVVVYIHPAASPLGGSVGGGFTPAIPRLDALTMAVTDGTSALVGVIVHDSVNITTAPSGYTVRTGASTPHQLSDKLAATADGQADTTDASTNGADVHQEIKSIGSSYFSAIDEVAQDDTEYVFGNATTNALEVALNSVTDPTGNTGHIVHYAVRSFNGAAGGETGKVELFQGTTLIATSGSISLNRTTFTAGSFTLSGAEADSITNYADLRLRFTGVTLGSGEWYGVSWANMEVPDPPAASFDQPMFQGGPREGSALTDALALWSVADQDTEAGPSDLIDQGTPGPAIIDLAATFAGTGTLTASLDNVPALVGLLQGGPWDGSAIVNAMQVWAAADDADEPSPSQRIEAPGGPAIIDLTATFAGTGTLAATLDRLTPEGTGEQFNNWRGGLPVIQRALGGTFDYWRGGLPIVAGPAATATVDLTATMAGVGAFAVTLENSGPLLDQSILQGGPREGSVLTTATRPWSVAEQAAEPDPSQRIEPGPTTIDLTATFAGVGALVAGLTANRTLAATIAGVGTLAANLENVGPPLDRSLLQGGPIAGSALISALQLWSVADQADEAPLSQRVEGPGAAIVDLTATFAGVGALVAGLTANRTLAATIAGVGALAATLENMPTLVGIFQGGPWDGSRLTSATQVWAVAEQVAEPNPSQQADIFTPAGAILDLSATMAGSGTLAAALTTRRSLVAAFAGAGAIDGGLSARRALVATLAGSGALDALPTRVRSLVVAFAGVGTLVVTLENIGSIVTYNLSATMAGMGGFIATMSARRNLQAPFGGEGRLYVTVLLPDVSFVRLNRLALGVPRLGDARMTEMPGEGGAEGLIDMFLLTT
jgi:hypothetical protein